MSQLIKLLVQTGVAAGTAFGKAFKQAVQNELKHGRASSSQSGGDNKQQTHTKTKSNYAHGMTLSEAVQILHVEPELDPHEIDKRFKHLFAVNEKAKGGSFYLQSKIYRARERLSSELERQGVNLDEIVGAVPGATDDRVENRENGAEGGEKKENKEAGSSKRETA